MEQDFYTSLRAGWHFSLPPTMPEGPIHEIIYKKSYPWET